MPSRSFSSEKSYSPSRFKVEVPPGSRRAVGHRIEGIRLTNPIWSAVSDFAQLGG
jgi:hypothetical protein